MTRVREQEGAAAPADLGTEHRCPMCGQDFPSGEMSCHAGCPMVSHCRVLCCPRCGYEFVDTTAVERRFRRLGDALRRLTGRSASPPREKP